MGQQTGFTPSIIPHLWYADQPAALAFLQQALGFAVHFTAPEPGGGVHAELQIGRGFVMVGPRHSPQHGFATPREVKNVNTGAVYIATPDVEQLYDRARHAGAEIVAALHDTEWASRDFTVRDPEGYIWHLGTYHPTLVGHDRVTEAEVFDALRYERAPAAIQWLRDAFGFTEHYVVPGDGDQVAHGLLRFGTSLLLISSAPGGRPVGAQAAASGRRRSHPGRLLRGRRSARALRASSGYGRRDPRRADHHALGRAALPGPRPRGLCVVLLKLRSRGARVGPRGLIIASRETASNSA